MPTQSPHVLRQKSSAVSTLAVQPLRYLSGYPPTVQAHAMALLEKGGLAQRLLQVHGPLHAVRTDAALYDYVADLKNRHLRNARPLAKVAYDNTLQTVQQALGTHSRVSRVQGSRLLAKREIRIASLFRIAPEPFLKMIVVHELAHLKHAAHDKAFHALCSHMEPSYHQLESDVRLWLCAHEFDASRHTPRSTAVPAAAAPCR